MAEHCSRLTRFHQECAKREMRQGRDVGGPFVSRLPTRFYTFVYPACRTLLFVEPGAVVVVIRSGE